MSAPSIYLQMTGLPRKGWVGAKEPRWLRLTVSATRGAPLPAFSILYPSSAPISEAPSTLGRRCQQRPCSFILPMAPVFVRVTCNCDGDTQSHCGWIAMDLSVQVSLLKEVTAVRRQVLTHFH